MFQPSFTPDDLFIWDITINAEKIFTVIMYYSNRMEEMSKLKTLVCPLCKFSARQSVVLQAHIASQHDVGAKDLYVKTFMDGHNPTCRCGCGQEIKWVNWKHGFPAAYIRGHNAGDAGEATKKRRRETLRKNIDSGRTKIWSKGQTRKTNASLAAGALTRSETVKRQFSTGERTQWSKGLTKESDARVRSTSEKLKQGFVQGKHSPWSKGLTKETDERVATMAKSVSRSLADPLLQLRLTMLKMLQPSEISRRIELVDNGMKFVGSVDDYRGINERTLRFQCNSCGNVDIRSLYNISLGCSLCFPAGSQAQNEIKGFISSLGFKPSTTRRVIPPYELDIFIEDKSFAIEFNGLWWHTDEKKNDKQYHSRKSELCAQAGVNLMHVFSDEWRDKRHIIESMIIHKLGLTPQNVNARDCSVIRLPKHIEKLFFGMNHIDGFTRSTMAWGLEHEGSVVAALSIRKPYHNSLRRYTEIARFAQARKFNVRGALGKLLSTMRRETSGPVITYVDRRHGDGHGYKMLGFNEIRTTKERFWWTDCVHRFDRFTFRADKDAGMTEQMVANEKGIYRIFGCKNSVLTLE